MGFAIFVSAYAIFVSTLIQLNRIKVFYKILLSIQVGFCNICFYINTPEQNKGFLQDTVKHSRMIIQTKYGKYWVILFINTLKDTSEQNFFRKKTVF